MEAGCRRVTATCINPKVDEMEFNKTVRQLHQTDTALSQTELSKLPQFYRAGCDFAYRLGGEVYREMFKLPVFISDFRHISIDSRVSMLQPGWFPCIPGWHCDDFYRPNGQPDLEAIEKGRAPSVHHMMVLGNSSLTEFISPIELPAPAELGQSSDPLYGRYDKLINRRIECLDECATFSAKEGQLIQFGPLDFHRGTPATKAGWRLFVRITQSNHREPKNEIRTQTQVYLTDVSRGW